jgi:hypothetical protein
MKRSALAMLFALLTVGAMALTAFADSPHVLILACSANENTSLSGVIIVTACESDTPQTCPGAPSGCASELAGLIAEGYNVTVAVSNAGGSQAGTVYTLTKTSAH